MRITFYNQGDEKLRTGQFDVINKFRPIVVLSHFDSTDEYICELESTCEANPTEEPITLDLGDENSVEYQIPKISFKATGTYTLRFQVKTGNDKSIETGMLKVQVSPYDGESMKLLKSSSKNELELNNVTLESEISIDIDVKAISSATHYITFYSVNDENKIICGKIRLVYPVCVCYDWEEVSSVIPAKDFVGWDPANRRKPKIENGKQVFDKDNNIVMVQWECFDYAQEQLRLAGYRVTGWNERCITGKDKSIYQICIDTKEKTIKNLDIYKEFMGGIKYIKNSIGDGIPVLVGINYNLSKYPKGQGDKTTDHFVVITGMGIDEDKIGKYFTYFDNATRSQQGTDTTKNRLYLKCDGLRLTNPVYSIYDVTQIRKSIAIKK